MAVSFRAVAFMWGRRAVVGRSVVCGTGLDDGLVDRHQFGAVREGGLHLDVRNHLGDAVHHVGAGRHRAALAHQLCHGLCRRVRPP